MAQVARIDFEDIERPTITVNLAGDERELPVTFDSDDFAIIGKYEDEGDGMRAFFAKYLGDVVYKLGDNHLTKLLAAWTEQRKAIGEPDLGEA